MTDYNLGETSIIEVEIKKDDIYINPASVTISIKTPDNAVAVDAVAMTNDDTGFYHYNYTLPTHERYLGVYSCKITGISGSGLVKIEDFIFRGILDF